MAQHDRQIIRARVREFVLPPIVDGLVLGRFSPIGHVAVGKALALLTTTPFEHLSIDDEVIGDVLIRSAVLRKIDGDALRRFILDHIKPLMGPEEILHLELEAEIVIESAHGGGS
jgi:hypothetical protein